MLRRGRGHWSVTNAEKGKRGTGAMTSAEKGKNVTIVTCVPATDVYVPPMMTFPRVRMNRNYLTGCLLVALVT